jgi:hypothetical protein
MDECRGETGGRERWIDLAPSVDAASTGGAMSADERSVYEQIVQLIAAYHASEEDMLAIMPTLPTLPEAINALGVLIYTTTTDGSVDKAELASIVSKIKRHIEILSRVATQYHAIVEQMITGQECPVPIESEEEPREQQL